MSVLVVSSVMPKVSSAQAAGPGYNAAAISGKVLANKKPIAGATVTASDCLTVQKFTSTADKSGAYALKLYGSCYTLVASNTSSDGKITLQSTSEKVELRSHSPCRCALPDRACAIRARLEILL